MAIITEEVRQGFCMDPYTLIYRSYSPGVSFVLFCCFIKGVLKEDSYNQL